MIYKYVYVTYFYQKSRFFRSLKKVKKKVTYMEFVENCVTCFFKKCIFLVLKKVKKKVTYMEFVENCVTCFFKKMYFFLRDFQKVKTGDANIQKCHLRHLILTFKKSEKKGDVYGIRRKLRHLFFLKKKVFFIVFLKK